MTMGLSANDLQGKVAIITGASRQRGIGRACALTLATFGADVVVTGTARPADSFPTDEQTSGWRGVESLAQEIAALGQGSLGLTVDVADPASVRNVVEKTVKRFGRLDILVCAHAAPREERFVVELGEQEWDQIMGINLRGTFLCCREASKRLIDQGQGGRIINISSVSGKYGRPRRSAYATSKAGIISFTRVLAMELASHRITANVVCPGGVDTSRTNEGVALRARKVGQTVEEVTAAAIAKIPLGRLATPQDIANMVGFLATSAAAHITGQAFNVDGGEMMV